MMIPIAPTIPDTQRPLQDAQSRTAAALPELAAPGSAEQPSVAPETRSAVRPVEALKPTEEAALRKKTDPELVAPDPDPLAGPKPAFEISLLEEQQSLEEPRDSPEDAKEDALGLPDIAAREAIGESGPGGGDDAGSRPETGPEPRPGSSSRDPSSGPPDRPEPIETTQGYGPDIPVPPKIDLKL